MASKIRADIAESLTGGPITLTKQVAAKATALWTSVTTTTLTAGFNISSLTDNGTGDTTLSYTAAFSNTQQTASGIGGNWVIDYLNSGRTTSSGRCTSFNSTTGANVDEAGDCLAVYGTLA